MLLGLKKTLKIHRKPHQNAALILGNGGAAKAIKYALNKNGITTKTVSRNSELNFENLDKETVQNHHIIVQCTPLGTFPNTQDA